VPSPPKNALGRTKEALWRARVSVERALADVRIRGSENLVTFDGARVPGLRIRVNGDRNRIRIPASCYLRGAFIQVEGSNNEVVFGDAVKVSLGAKIVVNDDEGRLSVGRGTTIESVRLEVAGGASLSIGDDCMLAYEVDVRNTDSHSVLSLDTGERLNPDADVVIGDRVWVGAHAMVMKGTVIGNDSVIASRSVLTRAVPEHSVAAGVPARIVRQGVRWDRRRL
tara:strand:- start:1839 stop:2513 length:675 start_codon:yes stop_codon:yes gene_type:complete